MRRLRRAVTAPLRRLGAAVDRLVPVGGRGDGGSAVVEFVTLGVLLLVPTVYLVVLLSRVQAAVFATEAAARGAARAVSAADTETEGRRAALAVVGYALSDQSFGDDPAAATDLACSASPCLTPGATVTVAVEVVVPLPGVPALGRVAPAALPVSASHTAVVDQFRGSP